MKQQLYDYDIYPKIVPSESEVLITIKPLSPHRAFVENEYVIKVFPMTSEIKAKTSPIVFEVLVKPIDGEISFSHSFVGEQEHSIRIFKKGEARQLASLAVYSLLPDLFERTPLMGDFHVHSCHSDGLESPAFVSAMYRQYGFDFAPITDHGMYYPSQEAIDAYKEVDIDFKIYHGEEVHTPGNHVHIINFGGDFCVNELAKHDTNRLWSCDPKEEWLDEVQKLSETLADPPVGVDKFVWASCMLVYKKIREGNGMCIFCHPNWIADVYHVTEEMTRFFLENNFADCFELIGGQSNQENMMQIALWQEMQAAGHKIPVVGNSDSHGTINGGSDNLFRRMKTIVLAKSNTKEDIIEAVKNGYSTAIYINGGDSDNAQMYSSYRMVSYTMFLYYNYFPLHDELCYEEGRLMRAYIGGDNAVAVRLKALKGQTDKLIKHIFAKR